MNTSINKTIATNISKIAVGGNIEVTLKVNNNGSLKFMINNNNLDHLTYILDLMNPNGKVETQQNTQYNNLRFQKNMLFGQKNTNKMNAGW